VDRLGEKTLIHNYGHGGGGVTLSWGTADLAVERALGSEESRVAVLGCGAVGLATARLLQRSGRQVTIHAKDLPPNTTSNIAGAQWSPFSVFDESHITQAFDAQFNRAARLAYRHFQDLPASQYGIRWIENYSIGDEPIQMPRFFESLRDLYPDVAELAPNEHPFGTRHAVKFTTMFIEPLVYLSAMMREFLVAGGRIVVREFVDIEAILALEERLVVNCTGLGARTLVGDEELGPVKGQLTVLVPQPEVDYILLSSGLYMMPRSDGILLGGTFERGVWTLEPNQEAVERVLRGHTRLFGRV
jgi:glycine/D-amino acid oxidase-like deaminating enzyme